MKYDVRFSCGHTEVKELFGPTNGRMAKISYWEKYGICSQCYREQKDIEMSINNDLVEMTYRQYKTEYPNYKTKPGSYNGKTKTIMVYVPKKVVTQE